MERREKNPNASPEGGGIEKDKSASGICVLLKRRRGILLQPKAVSKDQGFRGSDEPAASTTRHVRVKRWYEDPPDTQEL